MTVTVDNNAPSVSITAPAAGAVVSGTTTVTASASDTVGVQSVQFRVDGANVGHGRHEQPVLAVAGTRPRSRTATTR